VASLLEVGTGFHHELTGRENIFLNGAILGMTVGEIRRKFDEIVEFSGVERFIDTPVKRYSSGMYVRLAFAVAAHLDPEILVVDEVLAVGDADFQRKCLGKMGDVAREGRTVLIISHNLNSIVKLCARAIWLDSGKISGEGDPRTVVELYAKQEELPLGEVVFEPPSGQGGVALTRSWVMNGEFQKYTSIPYGKTFYVALEYEVKSEVRGLMVGFRLRNEDGLPIFRTATTDCPDLEEMVCRIGQHRAWVEIPGDLLSPGRYYTELGLWTPEFKHHFYMEKAFAFDILQVSPGSIEEILRPILNWQVT
jgi:lipopolysaccharide transport system ATP-binding protein